MRLNVTLEKDATAVGFEEMRGMPNQDYLSYISHEVLVVDHHDGLRSGLGGYPVATTSNQVKSLIGYLETVAARMIEAGK